MKYYDPALAMKQKQKLALESISGKTFKKSVFEAVEISFGVVPVKELYHQQKNGVGSPFGELQMKNIFRNLSHTPCLVYAAGIAGNSRFEQSVAQRCEVHAFDCTVSESAKSVKNKVFQFHKWCLGYPASFENNSYTKHDTFANYSFKTLSTTTEALNHTRTRIDLFKFDIEGFEWNLFDKDFLQSDVLPTQLSFELHTTGAKKTAVPEGVVAGKDYVAVNRLFSRLYDKGYRVVAKEINFWDRHCAEFVLINVAVPIFQRSA